MLSNHIVIEIPQERSHHTPQFGYVFVWRSRQSGEPSYTNCGGAFVHMRPWAHFGNLGYIECFTRPVNSRPVTFRQLRTCQMKLKAWYISVLSLRNQGTHDRTQL